MFLCYPEGSIGTWYESVFLFFFLFSFGKKEARKNETRRIEETNYRTRVYLEDSVFNFQDFLNIYYNAFLSFLLRRFFFRQSLKRSLSREIEAKRPPQWIVFDSRIYRTFVQLSDITYSYRKEYVKHFLRIKRVSRTYKSFVI